MKYGFRKKADLVKLPFLCRRNGAMPTNSACEHGSASVKSVILIKQLPHGWNMLCAGACVQSLVNVGTERETADARAARLEFTNRHAVNKKEMQYE